MNVGEHGNVIRFNVGEDISEYINTIEFISPAPYNRKIVFTAASGVVVGDIDLEVDTGTFLAKQYLEYTTQAGDFDIDGIWQSRVTSTTVGNTVRKVTDKTANFRIYP